MWTKYFGWRAALTGLALWAGALSTAGCEDGSCEDAARTFEDGEHWTCSDGCNGCFCNDGMVTSTLIACEAPPGEAAGKLQCKAGDAWVPHGSTWSCGDGCCTCDDGRVIESAESC